MNRMSFGNNAPSLIDVKSSERLIELVRKREHGVAWQPIKSADSGNVLYYESLFRLSAGAGHKASAGDLIAAAERCGAIGTLDHYMVACVLDELEAHPGVVLGVNISAQSAHLDERWTPALARLKASPAVAGRLVIEITETSSFPSLSAAVAFTHEMQSLGCRIAVDDFGDGGASIKRVLSLRPDIVKIDQFFATKALQSHVGRELLERVIGLARELSPIVIIEGVETSSQSLVAHMAGAIWQQGYFWARPSATRPWHDAAVARNGRAISHYLSCDMRAPKPEYRVQLSL